MMKMLAYMSSTHIQFDRDRVVSVQTQSITARSSTRNGTRRNLNIDTYGQPPYHTVNNAGPWNGNKSFHLFFLIIHTQELWTCSNRPGEVSESVGCGSHPWKRTKKRIPYIHKMPTEAHLWFLELLLQIFILLNSTDAHLLCGHTLGRETSWGGCISWWGSCRGYEWGIHSGSDRLRGRSKYTWQSTRVGPQSSDWTS